MRQFKILLLLLVFLIASCAAEEHNNMPKETPEDQKSIPTPASTATPLPTAIPTQTDPVEPNTTENNESYKYFKLTPVDQAAEAEDFYDFREELITNIKERNIDFLNKYLHEQGTWDFGGTTKEQLLESWDEEKWQELQKTVSLGGTFINDEKTLFIAPYTNNSFPYEFDTFEFEAAIKDHVEVYKDKNVNSDVIETLSYTIVKRIYEDQNDSSWKKIELPDGRVGYVIGDNIRSPLDYRVGFGKENNVWKINFFIAGD